jgi:hypothetical protein
MFAIKQKFCFGPEILDQVFSSHRNYVHLQYPFDLIVIDH